MIALIKAPLKIITTCTEVYICQQSEFIYASLWEKLPGSGALIRTITVYQVPDGQWIYPLSVLGSTLDKSGKV